MCTIPVKIFPENAYAETTYARDILTILVWLRWQRRSNERKIHAGNFLKKQRLRVTQLHLVFRDPNGDREALP